MLLVTRPEDLLGFRVLLFQQGDRAGLVVGSDRPWDRDVRLDDVFPTRGSELTARRLVSDRDRSLEHRGERVPRLEEESTSPELHDRSVKGDVEPDKLGTRVGI